MQKNTLREVHVDSVKGRKRRNDKYFSNYHHSEILYSCCIAFYALCVKSWIHSKNPISTEFVVIFFKFNYLIGFKPFSRISLALERKKNVKVTRYTLNVTDVFYKKYVCAVYF